MRYTLSVLLAIVALGLMVRWGLRSGRLRREHGPPPAGFVRWVFRIVTVSYVFAGGALVWWLLGDLIQPGWVQLLIAMAASVAAFWGGRRLEASLSSRPRPGSPAGT